MSVAPPKAAGGDSPRLVWREAQARQGEVLLIRVEGVRRAEAARGTFSGRPLRFFPLASGAAAVVGIDLAASPGARPFAVIVTTGAGAPVRLEGRVKVRRRDFGIERLTLPRDKVELGPETLRRVRREAARLEAAMAKVTPEPLWQGAFVLPVSSAQPPARFGFRRVINGAARSPHTGADIKAPTGTVVRAANAGRVTLVDEQFFAGKLVVLDHGLGVHTMYFHLARQRVRRGQHLRKGEPLGTVGSTGRATGAHLHFGVQVDGARVDPLSLLGLELGS